MENTAHPAPRRLDPNPLQPSLFSFTLSRDEVAAMLMVPCDEMTAWYKNDWLSFDPSEIMDFSLSQRTEVAFMKDLARSGLSGAYVKRLLSAGLEKPYCYDPQDTLYSFGEHRWVARQSLPDPDDLIERFLDDLIELEDWERLTQLQEKISAALATANPQSDQQAGRSECLPGPFALGTHQEERNLTGEP